MDNLFVGNVVPPLSSGASLPALLSSVFRPMESFRNDPDQSSDRRPKVIGLKSESVISIIPES
jgi:hypothetical protein